MTAFVFVIFLTVASSSVIYLWGRRRPVGKPLTWGEAFVGGLFLFGYLVLIYGVLPNQWLQWCDGPLKWRSDKLGIPLGPLHHWRVGYGHGRTLFTLDLLKNNRRYLGFLPVDGGRAWPHGITFFARGKIAFNAQDMRDIGATLIYGIMLGVHFKGWLWWQKRAQAAPATAELPTSAYGRPLVKKV